MLQKRYVILYNWLNIFNFLYFFYSFFDCGIDTGCSVGSDFRDIGEFNSNVSNYLLDYCVLTTAKSDGAVTFSRRPELKFSLSIFMHITTFRLSKNLNMKGVLLLKS